MPPGLQSVKFLTFPLDGVKLHMAESPHRQPAGRETPNMFLQYWPDALSFAGDVIAALSFFATAYAVFFAAGILGG
jgi:hypothetical protein